MAIYKSKQTANYTVLPNDIYSKGLSLEAIGMLSYLLSLPIDWVIYKSTLNEKFGVSKEKVRKVFEELNNSGYLISIKKFDKQGKISYEHIVYDKPYNGEPCTEKPCTVNPPTVKPCTVKPPTVKPCTVKPSTENSPLLSTNIQSTNKLNTNSKKEINRNDIIKYFAENGYSETAANKFFEYYSVGNWEDSKGNKVKNWKQKAQAVWFKPENKIVDNSKPKMVW